MGLVPEASQARVAAWQVEERQQGCPFTYDVLTRGEGEGSKADNGSDRLGE